MAVPMACQGTVMASPWVPMAMPVYRRRSWAFTITGMGVHGNAMAVMTNHVAFNETSWHRLPLYLCYEKSDGIAMSMQRRCHGIAMGLPLSAVFRDTNP